MSGIAEREEKRRDSQARKSEEHGRYSTATPATTAITCYYYPTTATTAVSKYSSKSSSTLTPATGPSPYSGVQETVRTSDRYGDT
ncbi:hypothetical protein V501_09891, partial [Pseudogymnoascus sp. VKM F-4519 (FW-2642)]